MQSVQLETFLTWRMEVICKCLTGNPCLLHHENLLKSSWIGGSDDVWCNLFPSFQNYPSLDNSGYSLIFSHFFQIILAVRSPKPTVDPPFDPGLELSKGGTTWTTAVAAALMDCTWWLVRWFVTVAIWTYLNITLAKGEWPWPGSRFDSYNEKQLMKMCADPQGCAENELVPAV